MKTKPFLFTVVVLVALTLGAVAAEAQTADFLGSTLGFSKNGDYVDNGSTCPSGTTLTQRQWTFVEDGVTRTGNPVTHQFQTSFCAYTVKLTITCSNGSTASKTRPVCFSCGVANCIVPDAGYN